MLQKRLQAWDSYEQTPFPLGRRGDLGTRRIFSNFKFQQLTPYVPASADDRLSAPIAQSLREALVDQRSGLLVQDNASVIRAELSEELKSKGVILTGLDSALRDYPEPGAAVLHDHLRSRRKLEVHGFARGLLERRRIPLYSKGRGYRRSHSGANLVERARVGPFRAHADCCRRTEQCALCRGT